MEKTLLKIVTMAAACAASAVLAEGDPDNGRDLARAGCSHCHGVDGNARSTSFQPVPMLAGQPEVYLEQEMRNYVLGVRSDSSKNGGMTKKLATLSDQDIQDIAAFFSAQKRY